MNMFYNKWREAALWAIIAAVVFEFTMNVFTERTLWHKIRDLESRVTHLEQTLTKSTSEDK